nr:MAG TPA: hypothetical protein [Caudoviricetes sp.]
MIQLFCVESYHLHPVWMIPLCSSTSRAGRIFILVYSKLRLAYSLR